MRHDLSTFALSLRLAAALRRWVRFANRPDRHGSSPSLRRLTKPPRLLASATAAQKSHDQNNHHRDYHPFHDEPSFPLTGAARSLIRKAPG